MKTIYERCQEKDERDYQIGCKVIAPDVKGLSDYLTAGKEYEIVDFDPSESYGRYGNKGYSFSIEHDMGGRSGVNLPAGDAALNGNDWIVPENN